jgi:archaellum component FlaC
MKTLSANESYDFLKGLDSQFKALDAFELEPKIENLNSLRNALDLTNPAIAEYYQAIANAESAEEREAAIDDLTTALLAQGDALLTNSEGAKILLENYAKTYGITDEFGEVLTTQAINAMKTNKRFNELNKTWKKTGKQIKANGKDLEHMNKTYDDMTDLYKDVAKAAKKTGKSIGDITKNLEGMTDEEKKMIEQASEEYLNIFKDLETGLGDTMAQLPQDMADAITGMDLNGLINSLITPESFGTLMNNVMGGSAQVQAAIAEMAADNDEAIRTMGERLQAAADANGNIDLGTILQGMGVDVSNPIAVLEALKSFLQQLAGTPYFEGAEAALGPVISALSAAQGL